MIPFAGMFVLVYHVALAVALPVYLYMYGMPSLTMLIIMVALIIASMMSVTVGYHRLYSHRSYKIHPIVEIPLLFFGTLATQGSIIQWSFDHRMHHRFAETQKDPYAITKGFWHAHMLWLFRPRDPIDHTVIPDFLRRKALVWQHKYYGWALLITNILTLGIVYAITRDFFGTIVFAFLLRTFLVHHGTWSINSLAHTWGERSYSRELTAVDNFILALITFGEGYHNYHHTFASDYRNGIKWYHFDPTKWTVWTLSKLGLASNLRRMSTAKITKTLVEKDYRHLLEEITDEEKKAYVTELVQRLRTYFDAANNKKLDKATRKQFKHDWKEWLHITRQLLASHHHHD